MSCHFWPFHPFNQLCLFVMWTFTKPVVLAEPQFISWIGKADQNLQGEYSNNWDFADFLRGSPGITYWRSYSWEKHFVLLCLFVKTSPINLSVASGNIIMFFTQKLHIQMANSHLSPQPHSHSHLSDPPHFSLLSTFKEVYCYTF